jgi:hypothetical protein
VGRAFAAPGRASGPHYIIMRLFRHHAARFVMAGLSWQLAVLLLLPTALCCAASSASGEGTFCPMRHEAGEVCPMHAPSKAPSSSGPVLGCAQSDIGFLALIGPAAVLPEPEVAAGELEPAGFVDALPVNLPSLALAPTTPPPRL